jgi:hypothetical protein
VIPVQNLPDQCKIKQLTTKSSKALKQEEREQVHVIGSLLWAGKANHHGCPFLMQHEYMDDSFPGHHRPTAILHDQGSRIHPRATRAREHKTFQIPPHPIDVNIGRHVSFESTTTGSGAISATP